MSQRPAIPAAPVRVRGRAVGEIAAPASKSVTNRLLVLAALADGTSTLHHPLDSDDTRSMRALITALGATVVDAAGAWRIHGTAGRVTPRAETIEVGLSGTTMRFGVALATLGDMPVTVTGAGPLLRRPVGPLTATLHALGAELDDAGGYPPVRLRGGGLRGGEAVADVSASSQFASAVLLVAPYAEHDVRLELRGEAAQAYIGLTASAMRQWGIARIEQPEEPQSAWVVPAGQRYQARETAVEYDASAAAHLLTLGAATGGAVTITNAEPATEQPDAAFGDLVDRMRPGGPGTALTGAGTYGIGHMPDQLPNAAVLAALADGESVFTGAAVVRGHETDRITALATELGKLGVDVTERPDGLRIVGDPSGLGSPRSLGSLRGPGQPGQPVRLATYDDHRLAMAFAALAAGLAGRVDVVIDEPWCVTKTYPGFWDDVRRLGLEWEEER